MATPFTTRLTREVSPSSPRSRKRARSAVIVLLQLVLLQPMLLGYQQALAEDCAAVPDPSNPQDASEAVDPTSSPDADQTQDPEEGMDPDNAGAGTDDGDYSDEGDFGDYGSPGDYGDYGDEGGDYGGDYGDGGGASGSPHGSDGSGFDDSEGGGGSKSNFTVLMDPIDISLGDKFHVQVDYLSRGSAGLRFARVYHSNGTVNSARVTMPMGAGWHTFYDRSLQTLSGSQVRLHRANGRTLDFVFNGSAWISALPAGVLTQVAGGWQYLNHRDTFESYDNSGRLLSLSTKGLVTSMQYDGAGKLVGVANPFGRSLGFSYDGIGRLSNVVLPDGHALVYAYDVYNNLVSARFTDGSTRQYVYENGAFPNALTGLVDESGRRRLTWGYDTVGRPNYGHYGNGTNAVNISYNGTQVITTDARGTQRVRNFQVVGGRAKLVSIQTMATADSAATGWTFSFDPNGNPQTVTTRSGEVRQFSVDSRGRRLTATRATGTAQALPSQTTWHQWFRKPVQIVNRGVTTNYSIDNLGRVMQVARLVGGSNVVLRSRTYNAQNLLQSITDARGGTTTFTYDGSGNRVSRTNALGQVTYFQNFDAHGQATRIQRPDGSIVTRIFDTRGRLTSRNVAGATTQYGYDSAGRIVSRVRPDGSWTNYSYDTGGYLSSYTTNRGDVTSITRDAAGKITNRSTYGAGGVLAKSTTRQLDRVGRVSAVVDSRNFRWQLGYGSDGQLQSISDPMGRTRTVQLDALSRIAVVTQPNTAAMRQAGGAATTSTTHFYDGRSNRQSIVDTNAVATGYAFDSVNQKIGESGSDAGNSGVVRNNAGDVVSFTDALGLTYSFTYDLLGRVTSIMRGSSGSPFVTYSYVVGRSDHLLASMVDASGSTAWTYDGTGRVLTKQQTTNGVTRSLTVARDTIGRPTAITYPSGLRLDITYGGDLVTSLAVNGVTLFNNIVYRPASNIATSWRWGNGTTYNRGFDADGRVTAVSLGSVQRSFGYDSVGQLVSQSDASTQGSSNSSYSYDEAGQLISFVVPSGTTTYTYDTNGNRRTSTLNGSSRAYSYAPNSNRMTSDGWNGNNTYNADGSASSYHGFSLVYGDLGRFVRATSNDPTGPVLQFVYNGLGQRVLKTSRFYTTGGIPNTVKPNAPISKGTQSTSAGVATQATGFWTTTKTDRFFYDDQGFLLGEYDSTSGYVQETVWFNGQPVAAVIANKTYYAFADHLGAPRSLVRASDNAEVWRWDSDPFGMMPPVGTVTYNLRFPGQYADVEIGLNSNGMRDYDPWAGRYIEPDPIGLAGGLSRYTYALANPLTYVDRDGLLFEATLGGVTRGTTLNQAATYGSPGNAAMVIGGVAPPVAMAGAYAWTRGGFPVSIVRGLIMGLKDESTPPPTPPALPTQPPPAIVTPGPPPPPVSPPLMCMKP